MMQVISIYNNPVSFLHTPVFVILSVLTALMSCNNKQEEMHPVVQNITESVYASGIVKSENQYQVYATVSGLIKELFVTEGEEVKKDQPIISIINQTAELSKENAQLAAHYADVQANKEKLSELQNNIAFAWARLESDSGLLERQRNLWLQNIGTRNDLEQRELAYKNSAVAYQAAILRYNDLRKQLHFTAQQARKNLEISTTLSDDFTVKSKTNGKVYKILKEAGEIVGPQSPVAIIGDAGLFLLELQVDEYDIAKIKCGQQVIISMDSYKGQVFEGIITKIEPMMDEHSRSFTVEAVYTSKPPALYPNLSAEANIIIQTKSSVLTIPRDYLIDEKYVLTGDDGMKKVVTGLKDYQLVEITSGLTKDDIILKPVP